MKYYIDEKEASEAEMKVAVDDNGPLPLFFYMSPYEHDDDQGPVNGFSHARDLVYDHLNRSEDSRIHLTLETAQPLLAAYLGAERRHRLQPGPARASGRS